MKQIALLSACNDNYGSLLQSCAFQHYLAMLGIDAEIIVYTGRPFLKQILRLFNLPLLRMKTKSVYREVSCKLFRPELQRRFQCRARQFERFRKDYLHIAAPIADRAQLLLCPDRYDVFIVGSDQLWNPVNVGTDFFTLNFVPDHRLKLSYATSFGVDRIPASLTATYRRYLQRFDEVSTREHSGQSLIPEIAGRDVPVVCDPTMLVDRTFWDGIKGEKPLIEGDYIFCYFIGPRPDIRAYAKEFGRKTGLRIASLPHIDEYVTADADFGDVQLFDVGPAEFVNLIANATYVLTDSFHGTVFSVVYEKSFFTFNRFRQEGKGSMNSRISSLLQVLGIPERRIDVEVDMKHLDELTIDYDSVNRNLSLFRSQSVDYLHKLATLIHNRS